MKLVELMLAASARPGVEKSYVVFNALIQAIERVKNEFHMEKHIDAELRDRQATETKLYNVGELRKNDLLARQVGFKDDPKLSNEAQIPLTKSVGWLPAKEMFNVAWQHRELMKEMSRSGSDNLTEAQKVKLAEIEKQRETDVILSCLGDHAETCIGKRNRPEIHPLRLPLRVLVRQVPIHLADQYAAVLVADPLGNRHEVNPRHDAHGDEKVAAIMEPKLWHTRRFPRDQKCFPKCLCGTVRVRPVVATGSSHSESGALRANISFNWTSRFGVKSTTRALWFFGKPIRTNRNLSLLPIHIRPLQTKGL